MNRMLSRKTQVAKKTHQCEWCLKLIRDKEVYERTTAIHEGEFQSYALHLFCSAQIEEVFYHPDYTDNGENTFDSLWNFYDHIKGKGKDEE